jgi:hypothetical protein
VAQREDLYGKKKFGEDLFAPNEDSLSQASDDKSLRKKDTGEEAEKVVEKEKMHDEEMEKEFKEKKASSPNADTGLSSDA